MISANAKGRIGRVGKIDMKQPSQYIRKRPGGAYTTPNSEEKFIPPRRRRIASAKPGRHEAIGDVRCQTGEGDLKRDDGGVGGASEHCTAIERLNFHPGEGGEIGPHVVREVIGTAGRRIIPHRRLRIVVRVRRIHQHGV